HDVQKHVRRRRVGRKTRIERRRLSAPTDRHRLVSGWCRFAAATARATARLFVTATATSGGERECAEQTDDEQKQSLSCHVCPPLGYVPGRAGARRAANQMLRRTCAAESLRIAMFRASTTWESCRSVVQPPTVYSVSPMTNALRPWR